MPTVLKCHAGVAFLLALAFLGAACRAEPPAAGKMTAEETESFLEGIEHGDYECAEAAGAWDYECVFTQDGQRLKIGVKVNSKQPTRSSGAIPAEQSFAGAEHVSRDATEAQWYADVQQLCARIRRDAGTLPEPRTLEDTKSMVAGLYALSVRFREELSSLAAPATERKRVDRLVYLLGKDIEDVQKLYDAVAHKDRSAVARTLRKLAVRSREEMEIVAHFGCPVR